MSTWIALHWSSFSVPVALFVFVAYFFLDGMFAYYTFSVTRFKAGRAATVGASMYVLSAFGIISFTQNPLYLFPLAVGSWLGTYVVVRREGRIEIAAKKKHH